MSHSSSNTCHCAHAEGHVCTCHHNDMHDKKTVSLRAYIPLVATLGVVIVFGISLSLVIGFSWMSVMEYWMGGYFVAFGVQQAVSLTKSAAMFQQYDPLAMRVPAYGYALPFIQIALGLAYFFMVWWLPVGLIALTVLTINVVGVDTVMRRQTVVRCGCLGESMNVPVGRVTLWENLIMIGMVVMMLGYHAMSYAMTGGGDMTSMPGMRM